MRPAILPLLCLMIAACSGAKCDHALDTTAIATDPVMARALNDPLMSDPDLASRNEANAVIGFVDSSALPVLPATSQQARAAREAARLELLESGSIADLPPSRDDPRDDPRDRALDPMAGAADFIAALGAPASCAARLNDDFAFAANLPQVASIMPRGMVVQAGGADSAPCRIRIIRYQTAAATEDILQYHYARAVQAGLDAARHAVPEDIIAAVGKDGAMLVVHVRPGVHGLSSVDLLYRAP
ncbi:MAG: hypothetical protein CVT75_01415 [Alphaproteobacteria bacterium HGW-Alphaproteobacteria-14]|nr:MAG: hypothetical protein CVT75_01415 [Alphaproteobacteria bacterium HGW-Alphaproteobacteria-14]